MLSGLAVRTRPPLLLLNIASLKGNRLEMRGISMLERKMRGNACGEARSSVSLHAPLTVNRKAQKGGGPKENVFKVSHFNLTAFNFTL